MSTIDLLATCRIYRRVLWSVCRYVGRMINNWYGAGTGPIWLDEVDCRGGETFIGDCYHRRWGSHDCRHHEDVSVSCTNMPRTTTTAPTPSSNLGRLPPCMQSSILSTHASLVCLLRDAIGRVSYIRIYLCYFCFR